MSQLKIKNALLKAIDISALGFLEPIVRLVFNDEPQVQIQKIGRMVIVPILAFVVFLGVWSYFAPRHKTASGEVPTPNVVIDAASGIWSFHKREDGKQTAYTANAVQRESLQEQTQAELERLEPIIAEQKEHVAKLDAEASAKLKELVGPMSEEYKELRKANRDASKERLANLNAKAEGIAEGDAQARALLLDEIHEHFELKDAEQAALAPMKAAQNEMMRTKSPELVTAQRSLSELAAQEQYLRKKLELLAEGNKGNQIAAQKAELERMRADFTIASGKDLTKLGTAIVRAEARLEQLEDTSYAKPWTLPAQIVRSVACVFVGFLMGTVIAVPIGVLCGLNRTFMASMTPFIALFKPVSPIVWLPIALIVVGGFIPDPDDHWLLNILDGVPLAGWLDINNAFIASAITVALCSLWATLANTALGVASIDRDHLNVARMLQLNFFDRLFKIIMPSSLPLIFAGLRISLGVGWMVLIAAELLSSSEGIGKFVWDTFNNGSSETFAQMFVIVFVVGTIGLVLDRIMIIFQRLVSFDGSAAAI